MTDYDLTKEERATLASFVGAEQPQDVDPLHFAKLLSMALLEQKEGGPVLTETGRHYLEESR
ncbi:hypothetical protein [Devosia rhizoryzae]|uniref:Segregation and condensation protein B n=1 Tax=Devosia rhizoryzae TaxID=2774137 RepID=A0ABX7C3R7_9HYPH|nr:hypothetical protein [Devosia rhizoryzae]QQR38885.1 hypothetical protein JI748_14180 [Devosia rhizoryzae]